jgi:hypothetical protein
MPLPPCVCLRDAIMAMQDASLGTVQCSACAVRILKQSKQNQLQSAGSRVRVRIYVCMYA